MMKNTAAGARKTIFTEKARIRSARPVIRSIPKMGLRIR
jgi:hypothetical protein